MELRWIYFVVTTCHFLCFLFIVKERNLTPFSDVNQKDIALRKLISDTGQNSCFDVRYNKAYEEYLLNPFLANENRGDWGKCIPELVFGALCIHESPRGTNDGSWQFGDGPLHDTPSQLMFLKLKDLHNRYCIHLDVQFSTLMTEKLNDYFFARNEFAIPTANDTINTYSFDVIISNGAFIVNSNTAPILRLTKGYTYSFYLTLDMFTSFPFLIGTTTGSPYVGAVAGQEGELKKIVLTVPLDGPNILTYYSSNPLIRGNKILLLDPSAFKVTTKMGSFYLNGQKQPPLIVHRGIGYNITVSNSDQTLFPFIIGTAVGVPYAGVGGKLTVNQGSYSTTIFLQINDASISSLVYYCPYNTLMTGVITILDYTLAASRSQMTANAAATIATAGSRGFVMPNCTGLYKGPRNSIRMSLYCALASIQTLLPQSLQQKPYKIGATCDRIARSFLSSQLYPPKTYSPLFCSQDPFNGVDACTVLAPVWNSQGRTCQGFCESFPGLTCAAASVPRWFDSAGEWQAQCSVQRPWSCSAPQKDEDTLLCTCKSSANTKPTVAVTVKPSGKPTRSPSASPAKAKTITTFSLEDTAVSIEATTSLKPTKAPTTASSLSPVLVNPSGQFVTPSCLKLLTGTSLQPAQLCQQDVVVDSCTAKAPLFNLAGGKGSCSQYCSSLGLQCRSAATTWGGCSRNTQTSCTAILSDYTLCECGAPTSSAVTLTNPDLNTKACRQLLFYPNAAWTADQYCASNLLGASLTDSCTVAAQQSKSSCNSFCGQFPGLQCLNAWYSNGDTCVKDSAGPLSCSTITSQPMLCTCGVDSAAMATFETKMNESLSNACLNIMFQSEKFYSMNQVCSSDRRHNTCLIAADPAVSCTQICSSYPGMQCLAAYYPDSNFDCVAAAKQLLDPVAQCGSVMARKSADHSLCQCAFTQTSPQATLFSLALFQENSATCPAYPAGTVTADASTSLSKNRPNNDDVANEGHKYGRYYKKLTLSLDYDAVKADGSAAITQLDTDWDMSDWSTDTYRTGTPEMCTGLVSLVRPGDPASKCSFGHRPYGNASYNCYGKLHFMTFAEASRECAARSGQLARVNSKDELKALAGLFVNDDELSIGLHDVGGNDWLWDGPVESSSVVDTAWFNRSGISFRRGDWTQGDCVSIHFSRPGPYLQTNLCSEQLTYLCEGIPASPSRGLRPRGGDLLADEGGFCLWYYDDPVRALPNDESGGFQNTELAHFLLVDPSLSTNKYIKLYDKLYEAGDIEGHADNAANWRRLSRRQLGQNSDLPVFPPQSFNYSFHCHFSPTNYGVARIYSQQHMLERLYTGSAHQHCFCGYKYLGWLVDRCDCTRSGEDSNNCQAEHEKLLFEETFVETGEYVKCNNCDDPSP